MEPLPPVPLQHPAEMVMPAEDAVKGEQVTVGNPAKGPPPQFPVIAQKPEHWMLM